MHATREEAKEETLRMLKVYEDFQRNVLALPVIVGKKTDKEKFAGAEESYTLEAMMYDGVALQNGTSHYFGNQFAKAFGIEFLNKDNKLETPYQTSWGVTTRMIGAIIMTHGDDNGLVLPPNIAPYKTIIIPIGKDENVKRVASDLKDKLIDEGVSCKIDLTDKTPGFKFAEAEVKGYPIRIEVGPRDLANNLVTLVRRDTLEKIQVGLDEVVVEVNKLLIDIQNNMYNRALKRRDSMIYEAKDYDEFTKIATTKLGFIKVNWCGNVECENKIKNDFGIKSRCLIDNEEVNGPCVCCQKEAKHRVYFGRQY